MSDRIAAALGLAAVLVAAGAATTWVLSAPREVSAEVAEEVSQPKRNPELICLIRRES